MPYWLSIFIRSAVLFFVTLLLARLIGKRTTSRMTFFDLATVIVIGVTAAAISLGLVAQTAGGLITLAVWTVFPALLYVLSIKYKTVRDIVRGREAVLVNHGKVMEDRLLEVRLTPEDLLSELRKKNVFNFADVEFAVMEPSGEVSVLLKKDSRPVTAGTLDLERGWDSVPQTVIMDGIIMDEPLTSMGLNRNWLHTELEKAGVAPENVFIAQVDSTGQLYLDLFDDAVILPKPKAKELLHYTLKKCQADCELYSLGTQNLEAKEMYRRASEVLVDVIEEIKPLLLR